MARPIESEQCTAFVKSENPDSGSITSCKIHGKGVCWKDKRIETRMPNVQIIVGKCLADQEGPDIKESPNSSDQV